MTVAPYDRNSAVSYAEKWAFSRNPAYYNFDKIGGDCSNFISQCIFAGTGVMNYKKDTGWYYNSLHNRAAGWSSVPYLYRFLITNKSVGPFAAEATAQEMQPGDIVQLGHDNGHWYHSLLVVEKLPQELLIAAHSDDAFNRPLSSYLRDRTRYLKIQGYRQ